MELDIPDPLVNITDRETALISAHYSVFPGVEHLLYAQHIEKDVVSNYKQYFRVKEDWDEFIVAQRNVIYASTYQEFETAWEKLDDDFTKIDP